MTDLTNPRLLYLKAALLLLAGGLAGGLVWAQNPTLRTAALLAACVWASCRAYDFAFYVIERYVGPSFRFGGMASLAAHVLAARGGVKRTAAGDGGVTGRL